MASKSAVTLPESGFNDLAVCRGGPLLYNRHDQYVGRSLAKYGEFSEGETELFRRIVQPGALIIEGGANIGAHTVSLSRMVGPGGTVLAFEPQRIVFQTLCANLALNSCANVFTFQCGLGETPGEINVPFLPPDRPANFGGLSLAGSSPGERVQLLTIDQLRLPACHFIKLDVEGMEVEAMKGAARTVASFRPILYLENDRRDRADELVGLLQSWGYRIYWHTPPLFSPTNFAGDPENIFGEIVSINILCVPRELGISVAGVREITEVIITPV